MIVGKVGPLSGNAHKYQVVVLNVHHVFVDGLYPFILDCDDVIF